MIRQWAIWLYDMNSSYSFEPGHKSPVPFSTGKASDLTQLPGGGPERQHGKGLSQGQTETVPQGCETRHITAELSLCAHLGKKINKGFAEFRSERIKKNNEQTAVATSRTVVIYFATIAARHTDPRGDHEGVLHLHLATCACLYYLLYLSSSYELVS